MVAAAAELFAELGYARTTLAKIAEAAGVSPETVQGHGPKAALMIAAVEYVGVGVSGEENIFNLEVGRQLIAAQDRDASLDHVVAVVTEVNEKTAPLAPALFGSVGADPELDRYRADLTTSITGQAQRLLDLWRDRGWLRDDVPFDELVETAAVVCSVENFLRITQRDGWAVARYRKWVRRMLSEAVFGTV